MIIEDFDIRSSDIDSMDGFLNGQAPGFLSSTDALKKSIQDFIDIPEVVYSGGAQTASGHTCRRSIL